MRYWFCVQQQLFGWRIAITYCNLSISSDWLCALTTHLFMHYWFCYTTTAVWLTHNHHLLQLIYFIRLTLCGNYTFVDAISILLYKQQLFGWRITISYCYFFISFDWLCMAITCLLMRYRFCYTTTAVWLAHNHQLLLLFYIIWLTLWGNYMSVDVISILLYNNSCLVGIGT